MAVRPYDRERDDQHLLEEIDDLTEAPLDQQLTAGMQHHIIRLSTALEVVLDENAGRESDALTFARERLAEYNAWFTEFQRTVNEQWTAQFGAGEEAAGGRDS